jgi:hypothetical protein
MANLLGQNIGTNYKGILNLGSTINTPVSGTAQYITDGDGTASALSVSTTSVGIGTSSPAGNLHIASASDTGIRIQGGSSGLSYIDLADTASGTPAGSIAYTHISNAITFSTDTNVERARISSNGLSFNGDTAAANALDDYEEGTFSPTIIGTTTAGTASYTVQTGAYTKIGRLVNFQFYIVWTGGTGTGDFRVGGLPFTSSATSNFFGACAIGFLNLTLPASGIATAYVDNNSTNIDLRSYPAGGGAGAAFAYDADGSLIINGSYYV